MYNELSLAIFTVLVAAFVLALLSRGEYVISMITVSCWAGSILMERRSKGIIE
jgi:hypothetical protein